MRRGNNIHVQQHKTNMINEEWNKTRNDAPFVTFNDMRAVTFVLPDDPPGWLSGERVKTHDLVVVSSIPG